MREQYFEFRICDECSNLSSQRLHSKQSVRRRTKSSRPITGSGKWDESNPVDPADSALNRVGYGILSGSLSLSATIPLAG